MTNTDLTRARRDVARKTSANAVTSRNNVIDGTARPTRSVTLQALKFLAYFWMALLFGGLLLSLTGYYTA